MATEPEPLDSAKLAEPSRSFLTLLARRLPDFARHARMELRSGSEGHDLLVELTSPTGDPKRDLVLWMENGDEPSVGFGEWHTHDWYPRGAGPSATAEAMIDLIELILADRIVLLQNVGGEHDGSIDFLDLRDPEALADELTAPWSPGRARILTWSGRGDREVSLGDLKIG